MARVVWPSRKPPAWVNGRRQRAEAATASKVLAVPSDGAVDIVLSALTGHKYQTITGALVN